VVPGVVVGGVVVGGGGVVVGGGGVVVGGGGVVVGGVGCAQVNTMSTPPLETVPPSSRSIVIVGPRTNVPVMNVVAPETASQSRISALELPLVRRKLLLGCSEALLPVDAMPEQLNPIMFSGTISV
jgi:hypothetical protein